MYNVLPTYWYHRVHSGTRVPEVKQVARGGSDDQHDLGLSRGERDACLAPDRVSDACTREVCTPAGRGVPYRARVCARERHRVWTLKD